MGGFDILMLMRSGEFLGANHRLLRSVGEFVEIDGHDVCSCKVVGNNLFRSQSHSNKSKSYIIRFRR